MYNLLPHTVHPSHRNTANSLNGKCQNLSGRQKGNNSRMICDKAIIIFNKLLMLVFRLLIGQMKNATIA